MVIEYYFELKATNDKDVIDEIGKKMQDLGLIKPKYIKHMHKRHKLTNVYMGNYLAIPHGLEQSDPLILKSGIVICKLKEMINFAGHEVLFVIGIAVKRKEQSDVLQKIALKFLDGDKILNLAKKSNDEVKKYFRSIHE